MVLTYRLETVMDIWQIFLVYSKPTKQFVFVTLARLLKEDSYHHTDQPSMFQNAVQYRFFFYVSGLQITILVIKDNINIINKNEQNGH